MSLDAVNSASELVLSANELIARWDTEVPELFERSVLSKLCGECISLFKQLLKSKSVQDRAAPYIIRALDRSRCTLVLWSNAYAVADGGLDDAIDESRYLRRKVFQLLSGIAATLVERLIPKLHVADSFSTEQLANWRREALAAIEQDYGDREVFESASESDGSDSDISVSNELDDIVESLETDTQLLMDLDRFIHAPSVIIPSEKDKQNEAVTSWEPQHAFAQIIRTRFPEALEGLVDALAKANLSRMRRCHEAREMAANEPEMEDPWANAAAFRVKDATDASGTLRDSGYGTMEGVSARDGSKYAQSQYAETVMSYAAGDRTVKIPPLPLGAKDGKPFDCVACGKNVRFTRSKMWKRHLFSDLQPWTCVEPDCTSENKTFDTRETWVQHLEFDHEYGPGWESRKCALCQEETGQGMEACSKHLAAHLEEISLATLPRSTDEDDVSQLSISSHSAASDVAISEDEALSITATQGQDEEPDTSPLFVTPQMPGWKCEELGCGMIFDKEHKLRHHMRYHNKDHKCPHADCDKGFGTKTHLERHINDKHRQKVKFYCSETGCEYSRHGGKAFPRKDNWKRHMSKKHGIEDPVDLSVEESASQWPPNFQKRTPSVLQPFESDLVQMGLATKDENANYPGSGPTSTSDGLRSSTQVPPTDPLGTGKEAFSNDSPDVIGPKIWTGTHFLPRFVRAAEVPGEGLCYFYDDGSHCKSVIDGEAVNAHWGVTKAGKPRKRLGIACLTCREQNIRCDPDYPRCIQCEKFGRVCEFKNAPPTKGDSSLESSTAAGMAASSTEAAGPPLPPRPATMQGVEDRLSQPWITIAELLYDFSSDSPLELDMVKGSRAAILNTKGPDGEPSLWWYCRNADNAFGYLPSNYLSISPSQIDSLESQRVTAEQAAAHGPAAGMRQGMSPTDEMGFFRQVDTSSQPLYAPNLGDVRDQSSRAWSQEAVVAPDHDPPSPVTQKRDSIFDTLLLSDKFADDDETLNLSASGLKRFKCPRPSCDMTLRTRSELNKHIQRHNKSYVCDVPKCSREAGFSTKNDLRRHQRTVHRELHVGSSPFYCHFGACAQVVNAKEWPRADNFRQHAVRVHGIDLNSEEDLSRYQVPPIRLLPPSQVLQHMRAFNGLDDSPRPESLALDRTAQTSGDSQRQQETLANSNDKSLDPVPQTTSYWSIAETDAFPDLLRYHGSDWEGIAVAMRTKTPTMVKNFYLRQKDQGKADWQAIVAEADQAHGRGADNGQPSLKQAAEDASKGTPSISDKVASILPMVLPDQAQDNLRERNHSGEGDSIGSRRNSDPQMSRLYSDHPDLDRDTEQKLLQAKDLLNDDLSNQGWSQDPVTLKYKCRHCSAEFTRRYNVKSHVLTHSQEKPKSQPSEPASSQDPIPGRHKCPYCSTEFTRLHNLQSHLLTHSDEKPYECQECKRRFRRLHELKRHSKTHTHGPRHVCAKCNRAFARDDALVKHQEGPGGCAVSKANDDAATTGTPEISSSRPQKSAEPLSFSASSSDAQRSAPDHGAGDSMSSPQDEHVDKVHEVIDSLAIPGQTVPDDRDTEEYVRAAEPSRSKSLMRDVSEEPYTIKCICGFTHDSGNTIYCETCDTWQHIECFFPDNREEAMREDIAHACADCNPRPLDKKGAFERMNRLRITGAGNARRKRPGLASDQHHSDSSSTLLFSPPSRPTLSPPLADPPLRSTVLTSTPYDSRQRDAEA